MEILHEHISQEKIQEFLSRDGDVNWITLAPETCICYGEGKFNNPTNLPVYHTHNKGGIIVCFKDDISFGHISKSDGFGQSFTEMFMLYLRNHIPERHQCMVIQHANDVLLNGRKVASFSVLPVGDKFITTVHLSLNMDLKLVQSICTKATWKIPGSLIDNGYTRDPLLKFVFDFLNFTENNKNPISIIENDFTRPQTYTTQPNGPIDICVMWVNPSLKDWREKRKKYMLEEVKRGTQKITNGGAFDEARYQDWNLFRYWFRCVEQNCPWVHKVFLILEDETHIPKWLNIDNPKLRIVYHREFIPNEALPQFNGPAIETWYSNIPDLSENFIACDDDYYFFNQIPSDWFFENDVPQSEIKPQKILYTNIKDWNWQQMMENDAHLYQRITKKDKNYWKSHLPEARKKSFEATILKEYYDDFYNALMYSHFRSEKGLTSWIFIDLAKAYGVTQDKPVYKNSKFIALGKTPAYLKSWDEIPPYQMICYNDITGPIDYNCYKGLQYVFSTKFPNKSSFEK